MTGGRTVVLSIHDVAPATAGACRRLREVIAEHAGPVGVSLLVVPRHHGDAAWDEETLAWLRDCIRDGDEPVLHGLVHRDECGRDGHEFGGDTTLRQAMWSVAEGRSAFAALGLRTTGFVAPSYSHPPCLEAALADSGLMWWATRTQLRRRGCVIGLPSVGLGASTLPRRVLSPMAARGAMRGLGAAPALRLDLHPADLAHRRLAGQVPRLLERVLDQGRTPVLHRDLLGH